MRTGEHTFTVAEFARLVRDQLAQAFPNDIWIQGEVRGMSRPASGHVYFDLVDPTNAAGQAADALVSVVLMRTTRQIVNRQIRAVGGGLRIDDGVHLRIRCAPDFYPPRGQFQLRMNGIDPQYTLGHLALAREQLLRRLATEGDLDRNARLAFPIAPLRIGLVTAPGSAAAADFLHELERSALSWQVVLAGTRVQGDGAHLRIAAAIRACTSHRVDVVAVVRGGGARTDLVAFDHELVARAIADCPVPVVTGIGHEIDVSVADEVAHLAFKTPTACAAHLVETVVAASTRTQRAWDAIVDAARRHTLASHQALSADAAAVGRAAGAALDRAERRSADAAVRSRHLVDRQLDRQRVLLERATAALRVQAAHQLERADRHNVEAVDLVRRRSRHHLVGARRDIDNLDERRRLLDPARVLARGWSITTTEDGTIVRSIGDAAPGTTLRTRVLDGSITSTVDVRTDHGDSADAAAIPNPSSPAGDASQDQPPT